MSQNRAIAFAMVKRLANSWKEWYSLGIPLCDVSIKATYFGDISVLQHYGLYLGVGVGESRSWFPVLVRFTTYWMYSNRECLPISSPSNRYVPSQKFANSYSITEKNAFRSWLIFLRTHKHFYWFSSVWNLIGLDYLVCYRNRMSECWPSNDRQ